VFAAKLWEKGCPARPLRPSGKYSRLGGRLVAGLVFVFLFEVGCSLFASGEEGIAAPMATSSPAAEWSGLYYADTKDSRASHGETAREQKSTKKGKPHGSAATTCDDLSALVDRSHALPPDYVPGDLVSLRDYGVPALGGQALRREAAEQLSSLVSDAAANGEELVVASAYRSYEKQRASHARLMSVYGAGADGMSAAPGHSQHQLGTAIDFTNAAASYQVWMPFAHTSAYWWLEHHAWEYGFVPAYPRGEEEQTGYQWEPWHYRYVGVEDAKRLEKRDVSLQEFLEPEGTMSHC
jgi:zinc D-Ala-D-Ala carboxypeptidase